MLVLSRHVNERLVIDSGRIQIVVVDLDFRHNRVRLGIEAPPEVSVDRHEIAEAKRLGQTRRPKSE
jgi:carbon storage regulator